MKIKTYFAACVCWIALLAISCERELGQLVSEQSASERFINPYVNNDGLSSAQGRVNPYVDGVEGGIAQNVGPVSVPAGGFVVDESHAFAEGEHFYVDVVLSNNDKLVFFLTGTHVVVAKSDGIAQRPESIIEGFASGGMAYAWGYLNGVASTWTIAFREKEVEIVAWHIGRDPLVTEILAYIPGAEITNSTSMTFGFASNDMEATFECTLDDGTPIPCTSPFTYSELADGEHRFFVQAVRGSARDEIGASHSWIVDTVFPYVTMTSATTTATTLQVDWKTSESTNGGMKWGDRSAPEANSVPLGTIYQTSHTILLEGLSPATVYYFQYYGYDAAGNYYSSPRFSVLTKSAP